MLCILSLQSSNLECKIVLKLKYLRNIRLFLIRILDEAQECVTTRMCTDSSKKKHADCSEAPLQSRQGSSCKVLTGSVLLAFLLLHDEGLHPFGVANYPVLEGGILRHARITVNSRPYQETWMRTWGVRGGTAATVWPFAVADCCVQALPTLFSYLSPSSCFGKYREFSSPFNTYSSLRPTPYFNLVLIFSLRLFMIFHTSSFILFFQISSFYLNGLYFKGRDHTRSRRMVLSGILRMRGCELNSSLSG
jgi:hypothetical protein